jgi:hypothetical protein
MNLFPQSCATQELIAFNAAQAKEKSYRDQFFPLAIKIF